jgi:sporulation protein YlmC with PRC-barrel domain
VDDLGAPIAYTALAKGTDVYDADGNRLGAVVEVRADFDNDIFDALVLDRNSLLPGGREEIPADDVEAIYERGVVVKQA